MPAKKPPLYKPEWYASPIDLPERSVGRYSIKHRMLDVGSEVAIVGLRQAMLRGVKAARGRTEEVLRVHELREKGQGVWMTDLPEELNQIGELLFNVRPTGRVCVGGLGLGILAATVAKWPGVTEVVVVEKSQEIIELCAAEEYTTVCADIAEFLKTSFAFDYYLLDTWQATSEGTWWDEVMPLRRTIRQHWGRVPVIHCWAEDIMWGQILRTLTEKPPHWYMQYLPVPMGLTQARRFLERVGLPAWEKMYGTAVDRACHEMKLKYEENAV